MPSVLLCIPPDYDYNFPPLGTPALAGFLKKHRINVAQRDFNIEYRSFLRGKIVCHGGDNSCAEALLKPLLSKFFRERCKGKYYSRYLQRENPDYLPALPYNNNTNSSFFFTERVLVSPHLSRYCADEQENTFLQFYLQARVVESLEKLDCDIVGISITSPSQVIASLTLGRFIKEHLPHIHVTVGGQWPTLFRKALAGKKNLFRYFDSALLFEGETPLLKLVQTLRRGSSIRLVPNILCAGMSPARYEHVFHEENMDELPAPDFDGLPLSAYDAFFKGQTSLTFETSRGCYWSKCAYCVDLPLPKPTYRRKNPTLVVRDMVELKKKYRAGYLMFGDPGLSPRQMREISRQMLGKHVSMLWWTMARLDPGFNETVFRLAHKAGLQKINFGFESASDRVCNFLDKGNMRERSERIIKVCAASGIEVDLQTMLGLPSETFEDGMETVDFLLRLTRHIAAVTFNEYYATPENYVYRNPRRYGVRFERGRINPFTFFLPFKNYKGMSSQEALQLQKIYEGLRFRNTSQQKTSSSGLLEKGSAKLVLNGQTSKLHFTFDRKRSVYGIVG